MSQISIYSTLSELSNETLKRDGFNNLVESVFKIAKSYIFHNKSKLANLCNEEKKMDDLAIDAISSLFVKNIENKFPICKTFEEWIPEIKNEEDAIFFLNKLTACRVEQHISKCLKEADPYFAKILDSLNYSLKKHTYKKYRILGQVYIIESTFAFNKKNTITIDDLNEIPSEYFENNENMFPNLFEFIKKYTSFLPAIPLNALAIRIKNINMTSNNINSDPNIIESLIFVNEIVEQGYKIAVEKLKTTYLHKDKLTYEEYEVFKAVLRDISGDIINGGASSSLYQYLINYLYPLSKENYKQKYQNPLEYLVKVMKNVIKIELSYTKELIN